MRRLCFLFPVVYALAFAGCYGKRDAPASLPEGKQISTKAPAASDLKGKGGPPAPGGGMTGMPGGGMPKAPGK